MMNVLNGNANGKFAQALNNLDSWFLAGKTFSGSKGISFQLMRL
jgi:hypothetical protein